MENIQNLKGIPDKQLIGFIKKCLEKLPDARRVLVLFPDYTRIDFTDKIAPLIIKRFLSDKADKVDFLNAGGTHRKMSNAEISAKLGLKDKPSNISYYNHNFEDKDCLKTVGHVPREIVYKKTDGYLNTDIGVTVNRLIFSDYDLIIALSATVPHEAAGFSGGLKIFFPGISGPEVIDLFHWAAVLVGLGNIIGAEDNNARDLINTGGKIIFENIKTKVCSFNMVNTEDESGVLPVGLFFDLGYDGFINCYKAASKLSRKVHIKYIDAPLTSVVQVIPYCYDEIWLAAKGSYKLQRPGVLAPDAEVIIYAPHIDKFHSNEKMQDEIKTLGYHCRDYVCYKLKEGLKVSKNAASHVINASGPGTYDPKTGIERKDFKLIFSTAIPAKECLALDLGYRDPATIRKKDYSDFGKLWIDNGGKYLYELKENRNNL